MRSTSLGLGIALGCLFVGLSPSFLGAVTPDDLSDPSKFNVRFDHLGGEDAGPHWQSLALGDLNGDGVEDLVVGVPDASTEGRSGNGAVYVIYGPLPPGSGNVIPLDTAANFNVRFDGPATIGTNVVTFLGNPMTVTDNNVTGLGAAVAVGDVNGDGTDDLVVGAPLEDGATNPQGGAVYVIPGPLPSGSGTIRDMAVTTNYSIRYLGEDGELGDALALGDLDGNGRNEIAVGAPMQRRYSSPPAYIGEVYVVDGPSLGDVGRDVDLSTPPSYRLRIRGDGNYMMGPCYPCQMVASSVVFGKSLEIGDWNKDGVADLAVGAPGSSLFSMVSSVSSVYLFAGPIPAGSGNERDTVLSSDFNVRYTGSFEDGLGWSLAKGDFNGDGRLDLAIASAQVTLVTPIPNDSVYLLYDPLPVGTGNVVALSTPTNFNVRMDGPVTGAVTILWGALPGWANPVFVGTDWNRSGLASGDLNGDGKSDLLVGGLNLSSLGRSGNGWVYLLSGLFPSGTGNQLDLNAASSRQFGGPTDNAYAGHAVGVGDLNHDGRQDIVIGCPAYPNSAVYVVYQSVSPTVTPSGTASPSPTPSATESFTETPTSTPTLTGTATSSASPTASPCPTDTPTWTPSVTPLGTPTRTPAPSDLFWISKNRHRLGESPVEVKVGPLAAGFFLVRVYNSAGEMIRTLRDTRSVEGGYESVFWDGRNDMGEAIASGVYVIAYSNGSRTRYGKLVVVK